MAMKILYKGEIKASVVDDKIVWKGLDLNQIIEDGIITLQHETTDDDIDIIIKVDPSLTQKLVFLESLGFEIIK